MGETIGGRSAPTHLEMVERLIRAQFKGLLNAMNENTKIGDFAKMIELHRKLAPDQSDQKEFWDMIEKIRQDDLPPDSASRGLEPESGTENVGEEQ